MDDNWKSPFEDFTSVWDIYLGNLEFFENELSLKELNGDRNFDKLLEAFSIATDNIIKKGQEVEVRLRGSPGVVRAMKKKFRDRLSRWRVNNKFMRRCLEKPSGFPGDYLTIEMIYSYEPRLGKRLAGFFDRYLLYHSVAVRSRKEKMKKILSDILDNPKVGKFDRPFKVLSLGSGSCREWYELSRESNDERRKYPIVQLVCLDRDVEALEFSAKRLNQSNLNISCSSLHKSLLGFSRMESWHHNSFDLIYGLGIADYFFAFSLTKILTRAIRLLRRDGFFVLTHKDRAEFNLSPSDWLCDWRFVLRTKRNFTDLMRKVLASLSNSARYRMNVERDSSNCVLFCIIKRIK